MIVVENFLDVRNLALRIESHQVHALDDERSICFIDQYRSTRSFDICQMRLVRGERDSSAMTGKYVSRKKKEHQIFRKLHIFKDKILGLHVMCVKIPTILAVRKSNALRWSSRRISVANHPPHLLAHGLFLERQHDGSLHRLVESVYGLEIAANLECSTDDVPLGVFVRVVFEGSRLHEVAAHLLNLMCDWVGQRRRLVPGRPTQRAIETVRL